MHNISSKNARLKLLAVIFSVLLTFQALFLFSPYFTYDSYHYLQMSLAPVVGDTHSFGFGLILRIYLKLAELIHHPRSLLRIYMIHQTLLLALLVLIPAERTLSVLRTLRYSSNHSARKSVPVFLLLGVFWLILLPGLFQLASAVWSELTYFVFLLAIFWLVLRAEIGTPLKWVLSCFLVVYGYHVRYQFVIVPGALLISSLLDWLKTRRLAVLSRAILAGLMFASIQISNLTLGQIFGTLPYTHDMAVQTAAASMQCTLRCDQALFTLLKCDNPVQTDFVEHFHCSDLTLGFLHTGGPLYTGNSLASLMSFVGPFHTFKWIVEAPVRYFFDEHTKWGLEIGAFEFIKDEAKNYYPLVTEYYGPSLKFENAQPRPLFLELARLLNLLHFRLRLYQILMASIALLSIPVVLTTPDPMERVLGLCTWMTLAIFAYFNAEVPIRFLIQGAYPGFIGCLMFFSRRLKEAQAVS